jgi:hypothetical protein
MRIDELLRLFPMQYWPVPMQNKFSTALAGTDLSNFVPLVDGEAKQSHVSISRYAAISRLCPIQDAHDFWSLLENGRSSPDTGLGAPAPG